MPQRCWANRLSHRLPKQRSLSRVLLLVVQMPGMDGYETTVRIREAEAQAAQEANGEPERVCIIAMTADVLKVSY